MVMAVVVVIMVMVVVVGVGVIVIMVVVAVMVMVVVVVRTPPVNVIMIMTVLVFVFVVMVVVVIRTPSVNASVIARPVDNDLAVTSVTAMSASMLRVVIATLSNMSGRAVTVEIGLLLRPVHGDRFLTRTGESLQIKAHICVNFARVNRK